MTTYYEDERRGSRGDYSTVHDDVYYSRSRSRPRRDSYDPEAARDYNQHSSSRELVRYDDGRVYDRDYAHGQPRRRSSFSSTYPRNGEHHHSHSHHHDDKSYKQEKHHTGKDIAATILGGIVGGEAARKASDGSKLAAAAGVLVGAWGGHELEKGWDRHEVKKERRRSHGGYSR